MIITQLRSENVKRITAVEVTPDGPVVRIAGKNNAGKSSVLDSISYALGGKELIPDVPIHGDATSAKIEVGLSNGLKVTRTFRRNRLACDCTPRENPGGEGGSAHQHTCAILRWSDTDSSLTVSAADGAQYKRPQEILDKLYDSLTFDPLAFVAMKPAAQNAALRDAAKLDFTLLDTRRKDAVERRSSFKQQHSTQFAVLSAMQVYADVPAEEIGSDVVAAEMREAENLRQISAELNVAHNSAQRVLEASVQVCATAELNVGRLRRELEEANKFAKKSQEERAANEAAVIEKGKAAVDAAALVPDVAALSKRLKEIEDINQKVRANAARANVLKTVADLDAKRDAANDDVAAIDKERADIMARAQFPVEGLSLSEDGVELNGLPLSQASTSEQLRVGVAMGLAMSQLKVLLVRNGNALDSASLAALATMAEEAGAQIWMEWVAENGAPGAVVIEDGHVRA